MVKSTINLPNGTIITFEGSPEELKDVLSLYNTNSSVIGKEKKNIPKEKAEETGQSSISDSGEKKDYIMAIVNAIKNSDNVDEIEKNILDKASQVDRTLLPLYIAGRDFDNKFSLTSNDIYKVIKELGIGMALPNISKTLKNTALKYVIADKMTKKGESTPYKISRKGEQYIEDILKK